MDWFLYDNGLRHEIVKSETMIHIHTCWLIGICVTKGNFFNVCYASFLFSVENKSFIFGYCKKFLTERSMRNDTVLLSILDGTNSINKEKRTKKKTRMKWNTMNIQWTWLVPCKSNWICCIKINLDSLKARLLSLY